MMPTEEEKLSSAVRSAEYWQSMYESEMQAKAEELDRVIQLRASLATVTAERDQCRQDYQSSVCRVNDLKLAMGDNVGWFDRYTAERAAHAETRKALELADTINGRTLKELAAANKAHADTHADAQRYYRDLESTRAALARSQSELETERGAHQLSVACHAETHTALARSEARVKELEEQQGRTNNLLGWGRDG